MILIILAIWFGYKKARDSGRNPWLWAAISGGVFIGVQLAVGVAIGVVIGVGIGLFGWSEDSFEKYQALAAIPAIIFSIVALWLIFRYLDRVPDEPPYSEPPPPPTFSGQE